MSTGSASDSANLGENAEAGGSCPIPLSHDRLEETHYHFHQMLDNYHHPHTFRYSTNAFLHALKSVLDMLRIDLERLGHNQWRQQNIDPLKADPLFAAFSKGRDVVLHRGSLVRGSRVEIGLFRGHKIKMAIQQDLQTDEPSHSLLDRIARLDVAGFFVDEEHSAIGEQLGVRRVYFEPQLSEDLDVVTASDMALAKVSNLVEESHQMLGYGFDAIADGGHGHDVRRCDTFLETDADPTLADQWGWN